MGTDKDWERWGNTDPYFGVLSSEKFRRKELSERSIEDFFNSGRRHVERVLSTIRTTFDSSFTPDSAMDFGCGVGRLVIPLAENAKRVVGVDISKSMIAEAARNCERAGVTNATFSMSDDTLSLVSGTFKLVHSYIVLQHIPWRRGRGILQALASRVEANGYISVQFLTSCSAPKMTRGLVRLRYILPPINWVRNAIRGKSLFEPPMQLHVYGLADIVGDLAARGFGDPLLVVEPPALGFEFESTFLFARRIA
jgi:2-polyprenyl-3-methyl-5-hydroxy-6-metoxy-1,4-benzoquinol methylase